MILKLSLALAVLVYFIQIISNVPMEKSILRSMLYFIVFYSVISINQIIYMYIKLHKLRLEEAKREEEKRKRREIQQAKATETLLNFIRDGK